MRLDARYLIRTVVGEVIRRPHDFHRFRVDRERRRHRFGNIVIIAVRDKDRPHRIDSGVRRSPLIAYRQRNAVAPRGKRAADEQSVRRAVVFRAAAREGYAGHIVVDFRDGYRNVHSLRNAFESVAYGDESRPETQVAARHGKIRDFPFPGNREYRRNFQPRGIEVFERVIGSLDRV